MKRTVAATLLGLSLVVLSACGEDNTAGQDAVASQGGSFQFYAPDGQIDITYPEQDRVEINDFSGESLMEQGKTINLSDYKDQVVVLNAWGQWCAPCRSEVDDLQEVQDKLSPLGGTVLGINVRDPNRTIAQDFVKDSGVTYPSIYDPPFRTAAALGGVPASIVPTTIVLDKQHRPAAVFLREITAKDVLDVALPLAKES